MTLSPLSPDFARNLPNYVNFITPANVYVYKALQFK